MEWIVNKYPGLAYIKDNSGNLPIHLAAAGGKSFSNYCIIIII